MPSNSTRKEILQRSESESVANNYSDAIDGDISETRDKVTTFLDNISHIIGSKKIPTGVSNCTLTATQWINPKQPLMKAQTIIDNGNKYGYQEIPEYHLLPGDLVIATNPQNNAHHTMLVYDFVKVPYTHKFYDKEYNLPAGHPLVRYSTGTTHNSGYRTGLGLLEYLDNSEGKTSVKYYRYYNTDQKEVLLPELIVTPNYNTVDYKKPTYINENIGSVQQIYKVLNQYKNSEK